MPSILQPDHLGDFLFRQYVGDDVVNADLGRDRPSCGFMITSQQDRAQVEPSQVVYRLRGCRLHHIRNRNHAARLATPADHDGRTSVCLFCRVRLLQLRGNLQPFLL